MEAVEKICVVCGKDCGGMPRVKDPRGRYYHKPCYEDARERTASRAPMASGSPEVVLTSTDLLEPDNGFDAESLLHELEQQPSCPRCGSRLRAGAVICVSCGFDVMEGVAIAPPVVRAGPRESGPRMTIWPIVVGLISIGYGGTNLLVMFTGFGLPSPDNSSVLAKLISAVFSGWVLLAGCGVLLRWQSGFEWLRRWAIVQIVLILICGGVLALLLMTATASVEVRAEGEEILLLYLGALLFSLIWPVFLVLWLRRPVIMEEAGRWR